LDTRSKITSPGQLEQRLQGRPALWVAGYFDPLLAEHVRRLRECAAPGQALIVEVANPTNPYLPQQARAELVAALSMVDFVVLQNGQPTAKDAIDPSLTERFVEHVRSRHPEEGQG
jgi:glycerol-3-phosphate cytidylyltransferase-like family protein